MPSQEEIAQEDFLASARGASSYQPAWTIAVEEGYEASPFKGYTEQELEQERADIIRFLRESSKAPKEGRTQEIHRSGTKRRPMKRGQPEQLPNVFGGYAPRSELLKEYTEQLAEVEAAQELLRRQTLESPRPDSERQPDLEIKGEPTPSQTTTPPSTMDREKIGPSTIKKSDRKLERGSLGFPNQGDRLPGEMDDRDKTAYDIADEAEMRGELDPDEHLHLLEETNPDMASSKARAEKVRKVKAEIEKRNAEFNKLYDAAPAPE